MLFCKDRFENKVAIVTGASSGIGYATATRLALEGSAVVLFARREELLKECVKEILDAGGRASYFVGDVTKEDDVKACVEKTLDLYGNIHILVNNAGVELVRSLSMTSHEEWISQVEVNLGGVIRFIQSTQRYMSKLGGSIINVGSIYGIVGVSGSAIYSMTKGGLISLTKSLALELASKKIRVNAISAGMTDTDLTQRIFDKLGSQQKERMKLMHPLGFGKPEDVAGGIAYLASDDARWITGSVLVIDGGYTAH